MGHFIIETWNVTNISPLCLTKEIMKGKIQLSRMALQEIRWWLNNAITLHRDIQHPCPSVTIQSDASKLG